MRDDDFGNGPEDGDYTITPCGSLGSKTCVGEVGGKFRGEFRSDGAALRAICKRMKAESFFPNVWSISDHGNVDIIDPGCSRRLGRRK